MAFARQLSLEDSPSLFETTFAVLDLETTGLSPDRDRITEVGVVKARRGEVVGEFATLVRPGIPIPAGITAVTGITDAMVAGHPPIEAVLPTLLEFLGTDSVLVAHNASFDTRFLGAALARHGYPALGLPVVDTVAVARRVLRDEVRSLRLSRLAQHFRSPVTPDHRALTDARATLHVLHGLVERVGALGATTLDDLRAYTRSSSDKAFRKVSLVADAPNAPGTYRFLGPEGEVLYVGTSGDLRTRLRRYFGGDRRRRIDDLVRETARVDWTVTSSAIEANVTEVRAIAAHRPRYNRRSKFPDAQVHLKLTSEAFPRLSIVTSQRDDGATYLGPVGRRARAQHLVDAIHDVSTLRQCTTRLRVAQDHATCMLKDLGRCASPCDGTISRDDYGRIAHQVADWLTGDPTVLLTRLRRRMLDLAADRRFEEAATARRRLALVAGTLDRHRRARALCEVDDLVVGRRDGDDREVLRIVRGRLVAAAQVPAAWAPDRVVDHLRARSVALEPAGDREREEVDLLLAHLDQPEVTVVAIVGSWVLPVAGSRAIGEVLAVQRPLARQLRRDHQVLTRRKVAARSSAA